MCILWGQFSDSREIVGVWVRICLHCKGPVDVWDLKGLENLSCQRLTYVSDEPAGTVGVEWVPIFSLKSLSFYVAQAGEWCSYDGKWFKVISPDTNRILISLNITMTTNGGANK